MAHQCEVASYAKRFVKRRDDGKIDIVMIKARDQKAGGTVHRNDKKNAHDVALLPWLRVVSRMPDHQPDCDGQGDREKAPNTY